MPTKSKKPSQPNKLAKFKRQAINFIASKNLKITKNIKILKLIIPLVIVNTLKGSGVKPARNKVPKK